MKRFPLVATLVVSAAVAVMFGLGIWQLRRADWKEHLVAQYQAAQKLPPIVFPTAPLKDPVPLFRWATGFCLKPTGQRAIAGESRAGEAGYVGGQEDMLIDIALQLAQERDLGAVGAR